jgi:hypothetical protein
MVFLPSLLLPPLFLFVFSLMFVLFFFLYFGFSLTRKHHVYPSFTIALCLFGFVSYCLPVLLWFDLVMETCATSSLAPKSNFDNAFPALVSFLWLLLFLS